MRWENSRSPGRGQRLLAVMRITPEAPKSAVKLRHGYKSAHTHDRGLPRGGTTTMAGDDQLAQRFGKAFPKGSVLFREGDEGREMFVIRSGEVAISKTVRDVEKQLSTLGPGEFFGEMSIITSKPRTATATVLTDAQLLVIDPRTFETMLRSNGEIAVRIIKMLASRLAEADAQIENLLLRDAGSRVVHYITHAAATRGQKDGEGVLVPLQIADLPSTLGLRPEQVKDVLQKLTRGGVAIFQAEQVRIPNLDKLGEFRELLDMKEKSGENS
jgi:CRP/FNR family transcriptional regulator, cyclic AMP receptor protein